MPFVSKSDTGHTALEHPLVTHAQMFARTQTAALAHYVRLHRVDNSLSLRRIAVARQRVRYPGALPAATVLPGHCRSARRVAFHPCGKGLHEFRDEFAREIVDQCPVVVE